MRKFRPRKAKKTPPNDATLRTTPPLHGSEKENVPVALKTVPPVRPAAPRVVIPSMPGTSGSVLQVPQIAALPRPQLHTLLPPGLPSPSTTNQSPWRPTAFVTSAPALNWKLYRSLNQSLLLVHIPTSEVIVLKEIVQRRRGAHFFKKVTVADDRTRFRYVRKVIENSPDGLNGETGSDIVYHG